MAFTPLDEPMKNAADAYFARQQFLDRMRLVALGALSDLKQIDEAAAVILSAPKIRNLAWEEHAQLEVIFAVPRAAALESIADAMAAKDDALPEMVAFRDRLHQEG